MSQAVKLHGAYILWMLLVIFQGLYPLLLYRNNKSTSEMFLYSLGSEVLCSKRQFRLKVKWTQSKLHIQLQDVNSLLLLLTVGHECHIRHSFVPFVFEVWGPQTWSACSLWHPHWHHHQGTRAGSSCWHRWREVGTVWRALIGRWHPSSSCRWSSCCSWLTAPLSKPCWLALGLEINEYTHLKEHSRDLALHSNNIVGLRMAVFKKGPKLMRQSFFIPCFLVKTWNLHYP